MIRNEVIQRGFVFETCPPPNYSAFPDCLIRAGRNGWRHVKAAVMVPCMLTRVLRENIVVTESLRRRFFSKTANSDSGCLMWTGCTNPNGYGKVKVNRRSYDTHVISWRIANGGIPVPVGRLVMHSCDVRACVNPAHLSLGTSADNAADCINKNRRVTLCGVDAPNAVLSEEIVIAARNEYAAGGISGRKLAAKYCVRYTTLRSAIEGRSWKSVTEASCSPSVQ